MLGVTKSGYEIRPDCPSVSAALRELWESRGLLYIFLWRDVRVRYRHTFLGAAWNVIQPLGLMVVYTFVFGLIFKNRMGEVAYPLFLFPAILLWQLFGKCVTSGGTSMGNYGGVLNRVYFPRLVPPAATVLGTVFDLAVSSVALFVLMIIYGSVPGWHAVFAPVFIGITLMFGMGLAVWLTALDANYKDIRHTLTFVTQFWLFASPVMYPVSLVPDRFQVYYALNPMVGLIQGIRWSLVPGTSAPTPLMLATSVFFAFFFLFTGIRYFVEREGTLVDTV